MPEAATVDTSTAAVTKPRGRVANDIKVLTQDNFEAHVDESLGVKKPAAKEEAKAEPAKEEKVAKAEPKKEEPDEEIDHPDEDKKGKLNERFSALTKARKEAEAKAESESKARKDAATRAEKAEQDAAALRAKYEPPKGDDIGPEPQPEQFSDTKEFAKALKDWTSESVRIEDAKRNRAAKAEAEHTERVAAWKDGESAVRLETPDYDKRLDAATVMISNDARDAIVDEGALGPRILLHLADNPEVAEALGKLPVGRMLKKIGEIASEVRKTVKAEAKADAKLDKQHTAAEISRAPAPISPLNGGGEPVVRLSGHQEFHGSYEDWKKLRVTGRIK